MHVVEEWGWQGDPTGAERPPPEGFDVFAHWSAVHPGINVEMDVPDGLRVTVHFNEWLAVDSVAGQTINAGEPITKDGELSEAMGALRYLADWRTIPHPDDHAVVRLAINTARARHNPNAGGDPVKDELLDQIEELWLNSL